MRSRTTAQFRKQLAALPEEVQKQAKKAYQQFKHDPWHSSLHFKQVHPNLPVPEPIRVLLDEGVPERLRGECSKSFAVETVRYRGWRGMRNGDLLRAAEMAFDALSNCGQASSVPAKCERTCPRTGRSRRKTEQSSQISCRSYRQRRLLCAE